MTFIQTKLKATAEQLKLYRSWTFGMSKDTERMFRHVLICQLQTRLKSDYDTWIGVPAPRKGFISIFCRDYTWDEIALKGLMHRAPYSKENHICYRYRIFDEYIEQFIVAGEAHLLSLSSIQHDHFYDVETGKRLNKLVKPFSDAPSTSIDLGYGVGWLKRQKQWIEDNKSELFDEEYMKHVRGYNHALRCFQGMLERLTEVNWTKGQAKYSQQLVEPDEGLRLYELGGGLQGANKNFREALLLTSPVINYDAVKCHAVIANKLMSEVGIESGLQEILDGKVTPPHRLLSVDTTKTAILATLNGAAMVKKLDTKYTLPNLVMSSPQYSMLSTSTKSSMVSALVNYCRSTAQAIKKWSKLLPQHERIATISAVLQREEKQTLRPMLSQATNNQHDGALVPTGTSIPSQLGVLEVQPKRISSPDPKFVEKNEDGSTICYPNGQPVQIEYFSMSPMGSLNMVDLIMSTGDRLQAVEFATKNTSDINNSLTNTLKSTLESK